MAHIRHLVLNRAVLGKIFRKVFGNFYSEKNFDISLLISYVLDIEN